MNRGTQTRMALLPLGMSLNFGHHRGSTVDSSPAKEALFSHVRSFFSGHRLVSERWHDEQIKDRVPDLDVVRVAPGPKTGLWTYVSSGCWDAQHYDDSGHGLEFCMTADEATPDYAEHVVQTAYYHCGPPTQRLDEGHTLPLGEGWTPGSALDHFLVSLPVPFGPDLEICDWDGGHARILWLLPITRAERDFKAENGQEALEQRFDEGAIEYWDSGRPSVV